MCVVSISYFTSIAIDSLAAWAAGAVVAVVVQKVLFTGVQMDDNDDE